MAFVGPMAMALALGAMALFDDRDERAAAAEVGAGGAGRTTVCSTARWRCSRWRRSRSSSSIRCSCKVVIPWGGRELKMYGAIAMIPYYVGVRAVRLPGRAHALQGAALPVHGGDPVRPVGAGEGARGAGAAGDRVRRVPRVHLELAPAGAGAAPLRPRGLADRVRGGRGAVAPRDADPPRRARSGTSCSATTTGAGWSSAATATAARSSTSCASSATACCPGWRSRRRRSAGRSRGGAAHGATGTAIRRRRASRGSSGWARSGSWPSYAVVSLSMTKFHHYVLPAIPGLAIVIGCFLDDLVARKASRTDGGGRAGRPAAAGAGDRRSASAKNAAQQFLWLFSYDYVHSKAGRPWPDRLDFSTPLIVFSVVFALATIALAMPRVRRCAAVGAVGRRRRRSRSSAGPLHAHGRAVLVAEGTDRDLLPRALVARRAADRLPALLARRDLLHVERDLRRPQRGAHGLRSGRRGRQAEGVGVDATAAAASTSCSSATRRARIKNLLPAEARGSFSVVDEQNNKFSLARADLWADL